MLEDLMSRCTDTISVGAFDSTARRRVHAVLYLCLSRQRRFEQTTSSLLAALARQSLEQLPSRRKACNIVVAHLMSKDSRSVQSLEALLAQSIEGSRCAYIVVDGLDEVSSDPDDRMALLNSLRAIQGRFREYGQVRICVLSRERPPSNTALGHPWIVEIESAEEDVVAYVDKRIERSSALSGWTYDEHLLRTDILDKIARRPKVL